MKSDTPGRVSTFAALLLDIHTHWKQTRRGAYTMPEDDKDAQGLNTEKNIPLIQVQSEHYDIPREPTPVITGSGPTWQLHEEDITYHNRYGAEEEKHGPLGTDEAHTNLLQH
jgi:hypothetical protein